MIHISIRDKYEKLGVDEYYKVHADEYENPHEQQVIKLLENNIARINISNVLDLCSGGGEVTAIVLDKGGEATGLDPYTCDLYVKKTGKQCLELGFNDILAGRLEGSWSCIICSFGIHLAKEKDLFMLVKELFMHTEQLVIIAPHKRPMLDRFEGIKLEFSDNILTPKEKKIYLRSYRKEP